MFLRGGAGSSGATVAGCSASIDAIRVLGEHVAATLRAHGLENTVVISNGIEEPPARSNADAGGVRFDANAVPLRRQDRARQGHRDARWSSSTPSGTTDSPFCLHVVGEWENAAYEDASRGRGARPRPRGPRRVPRTDSSATPKWARVCPGTPSPSPHALGRPAGDDPRGTRVRPAGRRDPDRRDPRHDPHGRRGLPDGRQLRRPSSERAYSRSCGTSRPTPATARALAPRSSSGSRRPSSGREWRACCVRRLPSGFGAPRADTAARGPGGDHGLRSRGNAGAIDAAGDAVPEDG